MGTRSAKILRDASIEEFDEEGYLVANPDVRKAVQSGRLTSGIDHFRRHGQFEGRKIRSSASIPEIRARKLTKIEGILRRDLPYTLDDGKYNFLSENLKHISGVSHTDKISENEYDKNIIAIIEKYKDGIILDCGAGARDVYYDNVVNLEIKNYDTTDVIAVGESIPFKDDSFDAVISVAVLEHVRNPFECAREIARVLRPGGELYCCVPFLQPYHGYPHHYFNVTHQGIRRLFEDHLQVDDVTVLDSTHPIFSLTWILSAWERGLAGAAREEFRELKVSDLLASPQQFLAKGFCRELSMEKRTELASAFVLRATKPLSGAN
jgi:SAM-dependent methyltransferase